VKYETLGLTLSQQKLELTIAHKLLQLQSKMDEMQKELDTLALLHRSVGGGGGSSINSIADIATKDHDLLDGLLDDDHTQYVPTDGVARQLANVGYPNALLLDGTRVMTDDLNLGSFDLKNTGDIKFPSDGVSSIGSGLKRAVKIWTRYFDCALDGRFGSVLDIFGLLTCWAGIDAVSYKVNAVAGVDGSFTTVDGKTVTVSKGVITSIV